MLDYVLASSVLFFLAASLVTLIDKMAAGYYQAARIAAGNPANAVGQPIESIGFHGGFAPCGPHSALGNPNEAGVLQNPEECL